MKSKVDLRVKRSQRLLEEALLKLMKQKSFRDIQADLSFGISRCLAEVGSFFRMISKELDQLLVDTIDFLVLKPVRPMLVTNDFDIVAVLGAQPSQLLAQEVVPRSPQNPRRHVDAVVIRHLLQMSEPLAVPVHHGCHRAGLLPCFGILFKSGFAEGSGLA